ncbi:hypothetical protein [Hymenobacter sp. BT559]|uniref:hypothetical protein n=1 Tax=Hymenobacter sp. BT559 TaxID=2795729 RepID=UPI0018EC0CC9|nr:hypothetical protein [Hymenobacter sp. BT559]MBJ6146038.1 hypothetical protein [Hymenobacter sp. BT559]
MYDGADIRNNRREGGSSATDQATSAKPNSKDSRPITFLGVRCFLPLLVWSELCPAHQGKVRRQLTRECLSLTVACGPASWPLYRIDSYYILSKYVALPSNYNSA